MGLDARAIVSDGKGGFADAAVALPDPEGGEVLVEIGASGVCHTDVDSLNWRSPLILGHEGAGVVLAAGQGVTHVAPGDRGAAQLGDPLRGLLPVPARRREPLRARPHVPSTALPLVRRQASGRASGSGPWRPTRWCRARRW